MTTGNIKFSQLPDLPLSNITGVAIAPVVESSTNYKVSLANLAAYVNNNGNITANTVSTSGNITGAYFIGNGSQLTGVVSSYGDSNVAAYLPTYTGNVTAAVVSASGNITGNYFIGDGSQLTGIAGNYSNANVAAYLPTYTGNVAGNNLSLTGHANITGNIFSNGVISTSGYITTPSYVNTNGGLYFGATSAKILEASDVIDVYTNSNIRLRISNAGVNVANATFNVANAISASGNVTGSYFIGNGSQLTGVSATLPANITGTSVSVTGNVTGAYILGNGSQLTGLPANYGNTEVAAFLASGTDTSNIITTGNITGNYVTANYVTGNGSLLSSLNGANVTGTVANAAYAVSAASATSASTATTATNATTATTAVTAGTVTSASQPAITSVGTLTSVSVSGNVQAGNLRTGGLISATGNITGNVFIGNGSQLTGIVSSYGNANVAAYLPTYTGTVAAGAVSATGNVTGNYFIGNGSQLTGIVASTGVTSLSAGTGISLSGSTGNVTITATGGGSITRVAASFTPGAYNTSNTNQISQSAYIPANTITANSWLSINHSWNLVSSNATIGIYVNTANSLSGAVNIWNAPIASTQSYYYRLHASFDVNAANAVNNVRGFTEPQGNLYLNSAGTTGYGYYTLSSENAMTIDWTQNQYMLFAVQQTGNATANVVRSSTYQIYKM